VARDFIEALMAGQPYQVGLRLERPNTPVGDHEPTTIHNLSCSETLTYCAADRYVVANRSAKDFDEGSDPNIETVCLMVLDRRCLWQTLRH
jgi:hypothetical protein